MTPKHSNFLEIGPGRGDFLFWLAQEHPTTNMMAVEYKLKRYNKLVTRVEKLGFKNIHLFFGDAKFILPEIFEPETFENIFILFSDPWPKRKHSKNRLFQTEFVKELNRLLVPEGRVYIAHDDPRYVHQIKEVFRELATLFIYQDEGVEFTTFYADKWKKEGRQIESFSYRKIGCQNFRDDLALPCVNITLETD